MADKEPIPELPPEQEALINALFTPFIMKKMLDLLLEGLCEDERKVFELHAGLYEEENPRRWFRHEIAVIIGRPVSEVDNLLREAMRKATSTSETNRVFRDLYKRVAPSEQLPPIP